MTKKIRTVAILFGRKGSTGFPGKNLYPILGRQALRYPLLAAKNAKCIDKIYTSTDDPEIARITVEEFGGEHIERPPELCTGKALLEDTIEHAYFEVRKRLGYQPEYVVVLMCNAVNIVADAIDAGYKTLETKPEFDSAITVCKYNMFIPLRARKADERGALVPFIPFEKMGDPSTMTCDRDSTGDCFFADGGMTIVRGRCLEHMEENLMPFKWMGKVIYPVVQEPGGGDIDYGWQVAAVDYWLRHHGFTETTTPYDKAVK